jgi:hypothetical protein
MKLLTPKSGKSTLGQEFARWCPCTKQARIAVPFFTHQPAIDMLLDAGATVQMVVRLCAVTRMDALDRLAENDNVSIKVCVDDWFHTKLYIFDRQAAIFGSANLTKNGLSENHELSAVVTSPTSVAACNSMFEELWSDERVRDFDSEVSALARNVFTQARLAKRKADDKADLTALRKMFDEIAVARLTKTAATNHQPTESDRQDATTPIVSHEERISRDVAAEAMRAFIRNPHIIIETKNYVWAAGTVAQISKAGIAANATKQLNNAGLIIQKSSGTEHRASREFIQIIETKTAVEAEAFALDRLSLSTATKAWNE